MQRPVLASRAIPLLPGSGSRFDGTFPYQKLRPRCPVAGPAVHPKVSPVTEAHDPRAYPDRPFVAVSAAILRDGKLLLVRRARGPANRVFTLPGGVVEAGETLAEAVCREVMEETALTISPVALAGHREVIIRDDAQRVLRHFLVLAFAARWVAGEPMLNEELSEFFWTDPAEVKNFATTEGLAEIVDAAMLRLAQD